MKNAKRFFQTLSVTIVLLSIATAGFGSPIYCFNIFNNDAYANDSRLNFTVTVTDDGFYKDRSLVGFEFKNNSEFGDSSITAIYFDDMKDGNLLDRKKSMNGSTGVSFRVGAKPAHLPGDNDLTPKFDRTPEFSAGSRGTKKGINSSDEWFKVVFKLKAGKTYDDILAALAAGGSTTEANLRIGIHIQSLPKPLIGSKCPSDSASAINCTEVIPEPATIGFMLLGSLGVLRRKRENKINDTKTRREIMKTSKIAMIVMLLLVCAGISTASVLPVEYPANSYTPGQGFIGDIHTYQPTPVDMYDLDHYKYYTWGIDASDIVDDGVEIIGAELVFKNIKNYNNTSNILYVHLLDSAALGLEVGHDNQGGGDYFVGYTLVGTWTHAPGGSGNEVDMVFHFDEALLADVRQYIANDGVLGFGLDPDCHYYNDGVTFAVETIPEPATLILLGLGGLLLRKRR